VEVLVKSNRFASLSGALVLVGLLGCGGDDPAPMTGAGGAAGGSGGMAASGGAGGMTGAGGSGAGGSGAGGTSTGGSGSGGSETGGTAGMTATGGAGGAMNPAVCTLKAAVASCTTKGANSLCDEYYEGDPNAVKATCPAPIATFNAGPCGKENELGYCVDSGGHQTKHYYGAAGTGSAVMSFCQNAGGTWCSP
jgi:hypothetical protein